MFDFQEAIVNLVERFNGEAARREQEIARANRNEEIKRKEREKFLFKDKIEAQRKYLYSQLEAICMEFGSWSDEAEAIRQKIFQLDSAYT